MYKYNNIYFPDENYYNTNQFPKVWMELFDSKKNIVTRTQQDHTDLAIYAPNCTNKELARMLIKSFVKASALTCIKPWLARK